MPVCITSSYMGDQRSSAIRTGSIKKLTTTLSFTILGLYEVVTVAKVQNILESTNLQYEKRPVLLTLIVKCRSFSLIDHWRLGW